MSKEKLLALSHGDLAAFERWMDHEMLPALLLDGRYPAARNATTDSDGVTHLMGLQEIDGIAIPRPLPFEPSVGAS